MKKNYLIVLLLTICGMGQIKADTLSEGFESVSLVDANGNPLTSAWSYGYGMDNGWKIIGGTIFASAGSTNYGLWTTAHTGSKSLEASYGSTNTAFVAIPTKLTGTLTFWARKTSSSSSTKGYVNIWELEESGDSYVKKSALLELSNLTTTWTEYTVDLGTEGKLIGINMIRAGLDDFSAEIYEDAAPGTAIMIYEDEAASKKVGSDVYDYGLQGAAATKTFYVKNDGTAARTYSFSVPAGYSADASLTVAAGETVAYEVTQTYGEGDYGFKEGAITVSSDGMENVVINLKGIARDPSKIYVDFSEEPEGWTLNGNWMVEEGVAKKGYGNDRLVSPMIQVESGDKLYFRYYKNSSSAYYGAVTVQYSIDGENWTDVPVTIEPEYEVWKEVVVDIPSNAKYVAFYGNYIWMDDVYGLSLSQSAQMKMNAEDIAFGMINATQSVQREISNIGLANLTNINVSSSNANFTATTSSTMVEPNATANLTITAGINTLGLQEGTVTVSADDQDDILINVSAYVCDPEQMLVDFNDNSLPAGWTNSNWSFEEGVAKTGSTGDSYLTSPILSVNEGEELVLMVKATTGFSDFYLERSTDGGENWDQIKNFTDELVRDEFVLLRAGGIAAGDYIFRIKAYGVMVDAIAGFHVNENAPVMEISCEGETLAAAYDLGRVKESVTKTFTIANTGTGTLNVTIASSDGAFTVEPAELEVASGETASFDVVLTFDERYGEKMATITVTPTNEGLRAVSFDITATTADPISWDEDFEGGEIPTGWQTTGWIVNNNTYYAGNGTYMAYAGTSVNDLITPRLEAKANEVLTFEAGIPYDDEPLTVSYKNEKADEWMELGQYTASGTITFTAPTDGFYYIKLTGRYVKVDNFMGLKLALKQHDLAITDFDLPAEGEQYVEYVATVTVQELVGVEEEATAKLYVNGEEVASEVVTVEPNGTAAVSLIFTPTETMESVEAFIEVTYAESESVKTDIVPITIASAYIIDDTQENTVEAKTYAAIIVKYNGKAGWNTVALPFNISDLGVFGEGVKAYEFTGMNGTALCFDVVTELEAATPYVIYLPEAISEPMLFTNVEVPYYARNPYTVTNDGVSFIPTYSPIPAPDMEGKYGVVPTTGKIARGSDKASLRAFRAYFDFGDASANEFDASFSDGGVITSINAATLFDDNDGDIYDLSGRKMNDSKSLPKGVYVKNGKKYVVK